MQQDYIGEVLQQLHELSGEQLKQQYLTEPKFAKTLMLMISEADESQALRLVRLVLELDMLLGAKLAGTVKPEFQARAVDLVATLDIDEQLTIRLLGIVGSQSAIPPLLHALNHEKPHLRELAAAALGEIGSDAGVPGLLQALQDEDPHVRWSAASALGEIGSDAGVPGLLQALQDEDPHVRWSAAYAFGQIGSDAAVTALRQALDRENTRVRGWATAALGRIGSDAAVVGLLQALRDEDFLVRRLAGAALAKIDASEGRLGEPCNREGDPPGRPYRCLAD